MSARNLVMFSVDDMRSTADWGHFAPLVRTPNIDRLMAAGTSFDTAIAQVPLCNPSRSSVFSGRDPSRTGILDNDVPWHERIDPADTLPAVLRQAGAYVAMYGKNFHDDPIPDAVSRTLFDDFRFPAADVRPGQVLSDDVRHTTPFGTGRYTGEDNLRDAATTAAAVDFLTGTAASLAQPFFLGVGLSHPHLDWVAPGAYWDLYDHGAIRAALEASLADGTILPGRTELSDVPPMMGPYYDQVNADLDAWTDYLHGYLASISYADAKIGEVLDALAADPALAADTAIVFWSDNGFHLGDKNRWEKSTPWRATTEMPLVVVDPDTRGGQVVSQVVSLTDIYPTVLALMGIDQPHALDLAGTSLLPLLADPDRDWYAPEDGTGIALSLIAGVVSLRAQIPGEGDWRYTWYPDGTQELYDITGDPDEHVNRVKYRTGAGLTEHDNEMLGVMKGLLADRAAAAGLHLGGGPAALVGDAGDEMFVSTTGAGSNDFRGGDGDDTYLLYGPATIREGAGGGFDQVVLKKASLEASFVLPGNVEVLEVTRTGTGNAGDNLIRAAGGTGATLSGGNGNDTLLGNAGADSLLGGKGGDSLVGGAKSDVLSGGEGADVLSGEAGKDTLIGGTGVDTLSGGADADRFVFQSAAQSTTGASDIIVDFTAPGAGAGDLIDLSAIDARPDLAGDQAFAFGGTGAGSLRLTDAKGGQTILLGNTDADANAEVRIVIADAGVPAATYTAADLLL